MTAGGMTVRAAFSFQSVMTSADAVVALLRTRQSASIRVRDMAFLRKVEVAAQAARQPDPGERNRIERNLDRAESAKN